ncbi:type II secretion system protein, partial [bacterium]|nr:type II secretion system protein [bacterium]
VNDRHLKSALNAKDTLCIGALLHRRQIFDWKHHALVFISYVKNLRNRRSLLLPLRGFTLAEVLITLGIIGVVAALTIPTLMQSYQNKQYVSGFQKAWGLLNNVLKLSEATNGFNWDEPTSGFDIDYIEKYWTPYFNVAKNCGYSTGQGCFATQCHWLGSTSSCDYNDNLGQYKLLLTDGMSIRFWPKHTISDSEWMGIFTVDTNGPKGPNTFGRDYFHFYYYPQSRKILPASMENDLETLKETCSNGGGSCGAYLVKNGYKMDY